MRRTKAESHDRIRPRIRSVFRSENGRDAVRYRLIPGLQHEPGTAQNDAGRGPDPDGDPIAAGCRPALHGGRQMMAGKKKWFGAGQPAPVALDAMPDIVTQMLSDWPEAVSRIPDERLVVEPIESSAAVRLAGRVGPNCYIVRDGDVDMTRPLSVKAQRPVDDVVIVLLRRPFGMQVNLNGDGSRAWIGEGRKLAVVIALGAGSTVVVGDSCTSQGARLITDRSAIRIGRDAMISGEVVLNSADHHGVVDLTAEGAHLRPVRRPEITLGDHVWLGMRTMVIGNIAIGSGSIVGAGSTVTKDVPRDAIAAGSPAEIRRRNVTWSRDHDRIDPVSDQYIQSALATQAFAAPAEPEQREDLT